MQESDFKAAMAASSLADNTIERRIFALRRIEVVEGISKRMGSAARALPNLALKTYAYRFEFN